MAGRTDALQRVLESFDTVSLRPKDYQALGAQVAGLVFDRPDIREKYGLIAKPHDTIPSITYLRDEGQFVLQSLSLEADDFLFNAYRDTEALYLRDVYRFGNPDIITGGLALVIHDVYTRERSNRGLLLMGKNQGNVRRDGTGILKKQPSRLTKRTFWRAFKTIGDAPLAQSA